MSALTIRHEGGGLLAFYRNGKRLREIGVTPGWLSNDRDEVIAVFNERATPPAGAGEAVEMRVCEIARVILKPNVLYRFTVDANCAGCRAADALIAELAKEASHE